MNEEMLELVRQAATGDGDAFGAIYEKSYPKLFRYIVARVRNEDDAMEICQEIYTNMLTGLGGLQDPASFPGWMKRTVDNTMYKYLSKAYRRREFTELHSAENGEETDWESALEDADLSVQPEAYMDQAETNRLVLEMLKTLNEKERTAIVMRYYEDADVKQIAQALGCPEGSVKTYLFRGRGKVEKQVRMLEKQGVKLYSLAPLPFFVWMLRLARAQGTAAAALGCAGAAAGTGAAAGAKAGAAAKTAGATAGKSVATKVVAGALAVSMTVGAGATVALHSKERQNKQAHEIYENLLAEYREEQSRSSEQALTDMDQFWNTLGERMLEETKNPDSGKTYEWELTYGPGARFQEKVPLPDTAYEPSLDYEWLRYYHLNDGAVPEALYYAYYDFDGDGIDEMFLGKGIDPQDSDFCFEPIVYTVKNGKLSRGQSHHVWLTEKTTWELTPGSMANYLNINGYHGIFYIDFGAEAFGDGIQGPEPSLEWQRAVPTAEDTPTLDTEAATEASIAINEEENKIAHQIFEDFLQKNRDLPRSFPTLDAYMEDHFAFWIKLMDELYAQYGEDDRMENYSIVYTPGEGYTPKVPLPDTVYKPNMFIAWHRDGTWEYAYQDINSDGVDELLVRDNGAKDSCEIYMIEDGKLLMLSAEPYDTSGNSAWKVKAGIISSPIHLLKGDFSTFVLAYTADPKTFKSFDIDFQKWDIQWQSLY